MKYFLTILSVVLFCQFSFGQAKDFTPIDTFRIGPTQEFSTPSEFFVMERHNAIVFIDSGTYYCNNELSIRGSNLIIEGLDAPHIYCTELHNNVMWITSANNVIIRNLHMKHFKPGGPENQNCSGRVLGFDNARNITVENCDLNGCGLAGLHDNLGNEKIFIKNNHIHNNSLGAFTDIDGHVWQKEIPNHPVFIFENNKIENNGTHRVSEDDK